MAIDGNGRDSRAEQHIIVVLIGHSRAVSRVATVPGFCDMDIPATERGFLARLVKRSETEVERLLQMQIVLLDLDARFSTLGPERGDGMAGLRRIHVGDGSVAQISADFRGDRFILGHGSEPERAFGMHEIDNLLQAMAALTTSHGNDESNGACGVCYSDYIDGQLAQLSCPNRTCAQIYHESCLRAWFRTNPQTRMLFGHISGSCLFCEQVHTGRDVI